MYICPNLLNHYKTEGSSFLDYCEQYVVLPPFKNQNKIDSPQ